MNFDTRFCEFSLDFKQIRAFDILQYHVQTEFHKKERKKKKPEMKSVNIEK